MFTESLFSFFETTTLMAVLATFFIAGLIKGMLGLGMPAICMVLLTLFIPPLVAIPLTAVPTMVVNAFQYARSPARAHVTRNYAVFAATLIGVIFVVGSFIQSFPKAMLLMALGLAMVVFSVQSLAGYAFTIDQRYRWQIIGGGCAGALGGLSSVFSPPIVMYLVGRRASKDEFIGATGFLFLSGCAPLVLALVLNGVLTLHIAVQSLLGLVVSLSGFMIGEWARGFIPQDLFRTLIMVFFLVMGMRLVIVSLPSGF